MMILHVFLLLDDAMFDFALIVMSHSKDLSE